MVKRFVPEVEHWLDLMYIATEGAGLRNEDRRKAMEVAAMLEEVERAAARLSRRSRLCLVDAAAGKSYLGLLAAKLIFEPIRRNAAIVTIERDPRRVALSRQALQRMQTLIPVECLAADVADAAAWPEKPSIVAALHACGPAADVIIDRTIACGARMLLLVPCCTGRQMKSTAHAEAMARRLGIPRQAPVRRRFIQAMVDAERTWRLEAAGYETEVVEFVGATVTPHNLLWRARLVAQPARTAAAGRRQEDFRRQASEIGPKTGRRK